MAYLQFISDEHLFKCLSALYSVYEKCKEGIDLNKFYKNKVDPIKFNFDMQFNEINIKEYVLSEIARKNDKTINNAIGTFHENLLGGIKGFENIKLGGYDVRKLDNTIFAEIKNKHNTIKGEDLKGIHNKLSEIADNYPNSTCYLVHIIALKSRNEIWEFTSKGKPYRHPRVRLISADKFYELVTGRKNAFKELCDILPQATQDFLAMQNNKCKITNLDNRVYIDLKEKAALYNSNILDQIFSDTFDSYNGFSDYPTFNE